MNIRRVICLVAVLASSLLLVAEEQVVDSYRHSVRIGWGTAFSGKLTEDVRSRNTLPRYNTEYLQHIQGMTAQEAHAYLTNYRMQISGSDVVSSGHMFASYAYQFIPLVSFGVEVDALVLKEQFNMMNGYGERVKNPGVSSLYYLTVLPTIRLTYVRDGFFSMYSSVGVGVSYSGYSTSIPADWSEQSTSNIGITANIAVVGLNFHYLGWYAEAELGLMGTKMLLWPQSSYPFYTSRLLSLAVGYRF